MSYRQDWLVDAWEYGGPLVCARFSLSRMLWRIGPAWSVLAGAMVSGWMPDSTAAALWLIASVVLGDLAWGSLRQSVPLSPAGLALPDASSQILPYTSRGAPLDKLLSRWASVAGQPAVLAWQPLIICLVLVGALSLLLGPVALVLSLGVTVLAALAWLSVVNRRDHPALGLALLDVAAPWLLGMSGAGWRGLTARTALEPLMLMAGFTLLQWGIYRARQSGGMSFIGLWAGQVAVLAVLLSLGQIWIAVIVAVLFVFPAWWLLRHNRSELRCVLPWWWAAFALATLALT